MSLHDSCRLLEIALFAAIVGLLTRPLGGYLARVYAGDRTLLRFLIGPVEATLYRVAGVKPEAEQSWYRYAVSLLFFQALGVIGLYALLRLQPVCSRSWLGWDLSPWIGRRRMPGAAAP
jgi:K+-transporting ATPase ATPase A chain